MSWQVWLLFIAAACIVLFVLAKKKTVSEETARIRIDLKAVADIGQITSAVKKAGGDIRGIDEGEQIILTVIVRNREMLYQVLAELAELPFTAAAREIRAD